MIRNNIPSFEILSVPARRFAGFTLAFALLSSQVLHATSGTWSSTSSGTWSNTGNWSGGTVPGVADGGVTTNNTDTATFSDTTGGAGATVLVTLEADRNLESITFSHGVGNAHYTIGTTGGPSLLLTSTGTIQNSASENRTLTINAPLVLEGNGGSYTFSSVGSTGGIIAIGGGVTGVSTSTNTTTLNINGTSTQANAISGSIGDGSGGGKLAISKSGAGTWILSGSNNYSGGTTITAGTLQLGNDNALGTGILTLSGGTVTANGGAHSLGNNVAITTTTTVGGSNNLTFSGTFTNQLNSSARSLTVTNTGATTLSGPLITVGGGATNKMQFTVGTSSTLTLSGVIHDDAADTHSVAGSIVLLGGVGSGGALAMTNANSFTGGVTVTAGTLQIGNNSALGSGALSVASTTTVESVDATAHTLSNQLVNGTAASGGTYNFGAASAQTGNLTFTNSTAFNLGTGSGGTDTFAVNNTTTLDMTLSQNGTNTSIIKSGTGTLVLGSATGSNFSGGTSVNAGTLLVTGNTSSNSAIGSGALTVLKGAGFGGSGFATVSRFDIGLTGSGTAAMPIGNGIDATSKLTLNGTTSAVTPNNIENANLTFNLDTASTNSNELVVGNSTINFSNVTLTLNLLGNKTIAPNTAYVLIAGTGTNQYTGFTVDPVTNRITGLNLVFANVGGYQNSYLFLNTAGGVDDIEVEVVPEPGTWAMMLGGVAALILLQRRRKNAC